MKKVIQISLIIISLIIMFSSCTLEKRLYMPGYSIEVKKSDPDIIKITDNNTSKPTLTKNQNTENSIVSEYIYQDEADEKLSASVNHSDLITNDRHNLSEYNRNNTSDFPQLQSELWNKPIVTDTCDVIFLKNGDEIRAKVIEIGPTEIKYNKCEDLKGPSYKTPRSEAIMIKYSNGTKDIFTSNFSSAENTKKKTEGLSVASLILACLGFILGIGLSIIIGMVIALSAVILGIVSLDKISREPLKYKGRGLSIAGIVVGLLTLALSAFILLVILSLA